MSAAIAEITHEQAGSKGRYVAHVDGNSEPGQLTYSRMSPALVIVDYTGIPDRLRGTGVGAALAAHIIGEARAHGFRIVALCPFFKAQANRHPEWNDVIAS